MTALTRHLRRPHPSPVKGLWLLECDCGWRGHTPTAKPSGQAVPYRDAEKELNALFLEHIPVDQRQTYLLIDQRPSQTLRNPGDEDAEPEYLATGNYIMPEGKPCTLLGWWEDAGTYQGRAKGFAFEDPVLLLPIGEIRTAGGRVFRLA